MSELERGERSSEPRNRATANDHRGRSIDDCCLRLNVLKRVFVGMDGSRGLQSILAK